MAAAVNLIFDQGSSLLTQRKLIKRDFLWKLVWTIICMQLHLQVIKLEKVKVDHKIKTSKA